MLGFSCFDARRPVIMIASVLALVGLNLAPASAQNAPGAQVPSLGQLPPPTAFGAPQQGQVTLNAVLATETRPIRTGLSWRIIAERGEGAPEIVARSRDPQPVFPLPAGSYIVHVSYGYASATKRVTIQPNGALNDRLVINAGALRLAGSVADSPIPAARLSFSVFVPVGTISEGRQIASGITPGEILRLPEGTYHVVSTYGDANAIQRADVKVESAKLTEATLHHRAARVTLKLVTAPGGEAFAGTSFSVLTPGGDIIRETIGAFPEIILGDGNYVLIARHEGEVYTREFKVETGLDRDIEIVARRENAAKPN
jgi:hypothetical protein